MCSNELTRLSLFPRRNALDTKNRKIWYVFGKHIFTPEAISPFYVCVLVAQLCPTLCDPMDYSPSGSSVHGILQAEYWSGLPFLSPGDVPDPGIKPWSPTL